ncbi:MAG TPA: HD domain-containing protein [Gemmatimonadales bacterium]|nr:HD domain-containing protein [Gemmatimonadales bacterium]
MTRIPGYLTTRVGRRMLLLFLACALLPLTLLAVLGYRHVAGDILERTRLQLRADSKSAGMLLIDRFAVLGEMLGHPAGLAAPAPGDTAVPYTVTDGPRFLAVTLRHADGGLTPLTGTWTDLPALGRRSEAHLADGQTALHLDREEGEPRVVLIRPLAGGDRLYGWVDGASIWSVAPDRSLVGGDRVLCLADERAQPITCTLAGALGTLGQPGSGELLRWREGNAAFVAGQWTVFLGHQYAAPSWTMVVSVPEAVVLAPLATLRRTFLLGLLLALATVFALSHVQLRRQTAPLVALEAATQRVAAGRFDEPVRVTSDDEFGALATSFNRMSAELGHQFRLQGALQEVHRAALAGEGAGRLLAAIFAQAETLIPGAGLAIALARPDDPFWWRVSVVCRDQGPCTPRDARPGPEELEEVRRHPEGFVVRRGERGRSYFGRPHEVLLVETLVLPLLRAGALDGVMVVPCRPEQEGRPEALAEARRAAAQLAVAIANTQLIEQLDAMNWGSLTALARTIDAVSPWTAGHSERVTLGALEIGRRLGLGSDDLDLLHRGGLLHDIGKVGIPAGILDKPGKLTEEEYEQIKQHPAIGARILAPIGAVRRALPLVLHHHELLDGTGYPHGLSGEQIPQLVRILTVADVFDALVSDRPYRPAWPVERAIAHLREGAGVKFDAAIVEALAAATATGWRPTLDPAAGASVLRGTGRFTLWPEPVAAAPAAPPLEAAPAPA